MRVTLILERSRGILVTAYTHRMVRISHEQIKMLQKILKEQTGRDYTDEEAQEAGIAIMRFVLAKEQRNQKSPKLK